MTVHEIKDIIYFLTPFLKNAPYHYVFTCRRMKTTKYEKIFFGNIENCSIVKNLIVSSKESFRNKGYCFKTIEINI